LQILILRFAELRTLYDEQRIPALDRIPQSYFDLNSSPPQRRADVRHRFGVESHTRRRGESWPEHPHLRAFDLDAVTLDSFRRKLHFIDVAFFSRAMLMSIMIVSVMIFGVVVFRVLVFGFLVFGVLVLRSVIMRVMGSGSVIVTLMLVALCCCMTPMVMTIAFGVLVAPSDHDKHHRRGGKRR